MTITTIAEAKQRLNEAALDVQADHGDELLDSAWPDVVRAIASDCTPAVRDELLQREGLST